jgi:uncharacterized membrane protein (UPF0127 family)
MVPYVDQSRLGECRVLVLSSWANRRVGLTNHLQLPESCGALIRKTRGIHTYGMTFPIDVVVLDNDGHVVDVFGQVGPQTRLHFKSTRTVLELGPGAAKQWQLVPGVKLEFANV